MLRKSFCTAARTNIAAVCPRSRLIGLCQYRCSSMAAVEQDAPVNGVANGVCADVHCHLSHQESTTQAASQLKLAQCRWCHSQQGFNVAKDGWYTELGPMWPGQGLSLKVKEVLYQARSDFQDICVFESESNGTVLLLDGVIQCTDRDEFSYQEMIAHLPLCALEEPIRRVLVVGGGDGGVLRELTRYPSIQEIHMAEIDGAVPEVSKRFFPAMAVGFADPRVQLHITDGIEFVRQAEEGSYDAIIVDSSDPVGPAEVLFEKPFFEAMHRAVRPGGIVCTQAESLWLHLDIIKALAGMCSEVFEGGSVAYAVTTIPTYPSGQIGMMVCAKASSSGQPPLDVRVPRQPAPGPNAKLNVPALRYYNAALHRAAFVLPQFALDALSSSLTAFPEAS